LPLKPTIDFEQVGFFKQLVSKTVRRRPSLEINFILTSGVHTKL